MFVYIVLAFSIGFCALSETVNDKLRTQKLLSFGLILYLLVVGLRYWHGDYGTYEMAFNTGEDVGGDAGYYFAQLLFSEIGVSFQVFVFVITAVSVYAFRQAFRLTLWPSFALTIVLGKLFTLYAMSGIRQYIAIAVSWWAVSVLLYNKNRMLFLLLGLLATSFHGSAIIVLPLYFVRNLRFNFHNLFVILLFSYFFGAPLMKYVAVSSSSDFIDERFASYVLSDAGGMNLINYFENFLFLGLAVLLRKKVIRKIPYYDFFLYMFVFYCAFLLAGNEVGIVKRLRDYYVFAYAIIVPAFIYLFEDVRYKQICKFVTIAYFIFLMFRSLTVYDMPFDAGDYGRMIPYHSIFDMK